MRGGVILIAIALLIGYLGVTGRYKCFGVFGACIWNPEGYGCAGTGEAPPVVPPSGPIVVTPGGSRPPNTGVNPTGAPIYDARDFLPPIEAFVY
jgi:hypothetical protein